MRIKTFALLVAWLFLACACEMPGKCTPGNDAIDCPQPGAFCYGGKQAEAKTGVCVYGELSSAGKPAAKITTWKLVLHNQTEVAPLLWEKKDEAGAAGWEKTNVGMAEATVEVEVVGLEAGKALRVWTGHGVAAVCTPPAERKLAGERWTCSFKEGWAASSHAAETVEVRAQAGEADARVRSYRVLCSHNLTGLANTSVTQPLAMSAKRLLFGTSLGETEADSSLYVFDTAACTLVGSLHTGTVQGPMVALGDTGRVAVAIGSHGPPGREGQRLSLVDVSAKPDFVHANRDCGGNFVFDQGLSLLDMADASTGTPWRLMAPANRPVWDDARLAVYTPDAESNHCDWYEWTSYCFRAPMSRDTNKAVVGVCETQGSPSETFIQGRVFDATKGIWEFGPAAMLGFSLKEVSPLAVVEKNFWVKDLSFESPVAVDSQGRVYFAIKPGGSDGYHLRLEVPLSENKGHFEANSVPFDGAPVGSPILGEPMAGGEGKVYLVTTTGRVLAYGAELGEPLWTHNLGIHISPTAQPVLSGDTLWVVGAQGEIRGIRVGGHGLNRMAQWPKAFRDNCNTSSRLSTPTNLQSCF